jgi:hypothetical protein
MSSKFRHHYQMAKKQALTDTIRGEIVACVGKNFVLVKTSRSSAAAKPPKDESSRLLAVAGRALARPGISRDSVFGNGHKNVYAYSLDPQDPTRFIREAQDGTRRIGKMVNGKFKVLAQS